MITDGNKSTFFVQFGLVVWQLDQYMRGESNMNEQNSGLHKIRGRIKYKAPTHIRLIDIRHHKLNVN